MRLLKQLMKNYLKLGKPDEEYILDGFPRTIKQAEWLLAEVKKGRFFN